MMEVVIVVVGWSLMDTAKAIWASGGTQEGFQLSGVARIHQETKGEQLLILFELPQR